MIYEINKKKIKKKSAKYNNSHKLSVSELKSALI